MQSNEYENRDGTQLNDFKCEDGKQLNDLWSMDRVSLDMQSRIFYSNDADALTSQQKYPESSNRVSIPLQFEDFRSKIQASLTLHLNNFLSTC